jgi:glycosyltransferase involved in cell wall biosynthesis
MFVSILIPCYNAERWIGKAIESALAQTWPSKEIVVVDDGSTDGSVDVIRRYAGQIIWEAGINRGGGAARNRLLALSSGQWLQYLDADDYLKCDKIAAQARFIEQNPDTDIVYGPVIFEHWNGTDVREELVPIPQPNDDWVLLASWQMPQTGSPLWRKQAIVDVGGWKVDQPCCQEHELYLRLLTNEKRFRYFDSTGAVYRQWSDDTVCKRNIGEVHRRRLMIEAAAEDHLHETGQLSAARRNAINQARFEIARGAWQYDRKLALGIVGNIHASDPAFRPDGPAAPARYRAVYGPFGFAAAELMAEQQRRLVSIFN